MDTCHYTLSKPTESTIPRVKLKVWMIMMSHYRFINCKKCIILVWDVNNGRDCICAGVIREFSVLSDQFCYEPKTALKIKYI